VSNEQNNPPEDEPFIDDFVPPSNEIEQTLANIWSEVLGCGDISIHDEFLEVGGDSLFSIRILARINKAGLSIATADFFEFPTIAGQAKAISKASENSYEQGSTKGEFALIPIQNWLFERVQIDTHHWNQSILLAVDEKLDFASLERAFQKVLLQHDALRLAFMQGPDLQWQQAYLPLDSQLPIQHVDCSKLNQQKQSELIEQHCLTINHSMDLSKGNLAQAVFFESPLGEPNKLALVIHHLVIDAESWRILLEDLQNCWTHFAQGTTPVLPRKTTSFKHWSNKLIDYAQSNALNSEVDFWHAQTSHAKIPVDFDVTAEENNEGSSQLISTSLDQETTALLLQDIPKKLKVDVKDVLISALIIALQKWSLQQEVLIDIEGHGREDLFENINTSRTIGWFTTVFPVIFNINPQAELNDILLSVSNTLKSIPRKGIGHGLLRENKHENLLQKQTLSQVCFNYLGQIDTHKSDTEVGLIKPLANNIGSTRSQACLRAFYLEVNAKVENGQLFINWSYSHNVHKAETIQSLASEFNQTLCKLLEIDTGLATEEDEDDLFDLADFESDELDAITNALSGDN
jgi:non-ribosomal peptide synthase protein (TIGR01720 family)